MRYRVDTVPWPARPFYVAITSLCGVILYAYYVLCRMTSRVSVQPGGADLSQHAIFCLWHESWWSYFIAFIRFPSAHAVMCHGAAYMRPLHVVLRLMGLRQLLLGSSGAEGRNAANAVARLVSIGYSTAISPDGPHGPARVLKKGVLHIARQSGVPIVPITIRSVRHIPLPTWDSKKIPLPFNRITVIVHDAIRVTGENVDEMQQLIVGALGSPSAAR